MNESLRLWPGVAGAVLLVVLRYILPAVLPDTLLIGMLGGAICALAVLLWWLFFSRAPWIERIGVIALMVVAVLVTRQVAHVSIRGGMMGFMVPAFAIFLLPVALVAGLVVSRGRSVAVRRIAILVSIAITCIGLSTVRTAGIRGGQADLAWRWSATPEDKLLASEPAPAIPAPTPAPTPAAGNPPAEVATSAPAPAPKPAEWPGFRGPHRDGVIHGIKINTDWTTAPPAKLWRRAIGPGWSSFAVSGDRLYTQEQRGDDEIVASYKVTTGEPVWVHRDKIRFYESNAGPGPRATPTLDNGRVYAFGATGMLNALDAATGALIWSRDVAKEAEREVPMWGFSSSPLVLGDLVVVAASGRLAGYEAATGKPRWMGPDKPGSYSSPHRLTVDGVEQILMLTGAGATSVSPADGSILWEHSWPEGVTIVQPAVLSDGNVLINTATGTGGLGIRRLEIARAANGWTVKERWTSIGLKPYFNDFVVHNGHAYGFDGAILSCINLETGDRTWKGGRYGEGQLVLLADQDLLLVLGEEGQLALVNAKPDQFTEVARFDAIEGKTWNHPVVVGDVLLVRNGEEMAAYRMKR